MAMNFIFNMQYTVTISIILCVYFRHCFFNKCLLHLVVNSSGLCSMFFFFQETIESLVSREMARRYLQFDIKVRTLETGQSSQKDPRQPYPCF